MKHISVRQALCCVATLLSSWGCSLDPGHTWTQANISTAVTWSTQGRLDEDGALQTAKNYRIKFSRLEVSLDRVDVKTAPDTSNSTFDPANPPPGYTLCHNGHCHNEADELIDYEDIILELSDEGPIGQTLSQNIGTAARVDTSQQTQTVSVEMGACTDRLAVCELGPNAVRSVDLVVNGLSFEATVFNDEEFIDGWLIDADLELDLKLSALLSVELGESAAEEIGIEVNLRMPPQLWDTFEFTELKSDDGTVDKTRLEAVAKAAIKHRAVLLVNSN